MIMKEKREFLKKVMENVSGLRRQKDDCSVNIAVNCVVLRKCWEASRLFEVFAEQLSFLSHSVKSEVQEKKSLKGFGE